MQTKKEIAIEIGGRPFILTFDVRALLAVERATDRSIFTIMAENPLSLSSLAVMFWAALTHTHDIDRDAADLLFAEAGFAQVLGWVSQGLDALFAGQGMPTAAPAGTAPATA